MPITLGDHRFMLQHVANFDVANCTINMFDGSGLLLTDEETEAFKTFWDENSSKPVLGGTDTDDPPSAGVDETERPRFDLGD